MPIASKCKLFRTFKKDVSEDISDLFFTSNFTNMNSSNINTSSDYSLYMKVIQFIDYNKVNYPMIEPIVKHYFSLSENILKIVSSIENKYQIDYENTCCLFLRGTDKSTEVSVPTYQSCYDTLSVEDKGMKILLQSDETEFFSYFDALLANTFHFKDEIYTISSRFRSVQPCSINHKIRDPEVRLYYVERFLAIVFIMSKCKKVYANKGNIALWISLFRGGPINVIA